MFSMYYPGFQPFEREKTNHRSLFHINPKRICIYMNFGGCLTRQIAKGRREVSREIKGMGTCYIYLSSTRLKLQQGMREQVGYEFMDTLSFA
jgi:hypothetical protein